MQIASDVLAISLTFSYTLSSSNQWKLRILSRTRIRDCNQKFGRWARLESFIILLCTSEVLRVVRRNLYKKLAKEFHLIIVRDGTVGTICLRLLCRSRSISTFM